MVVDRSSITMREAKRAPLWLIFMADELVGEGDLNDHETYL